MKHKKNGKRYNDDFVKCLLVYTNLVK